MGYPLILMQNPNSTWSFVGRVPVKLGYLTNDGQEVSDELAAKIAEANIPAMLAKKRVFKSQDEALTAAQNMGLEVKQIVGNKGA
jgi:hypothetical protein